MVYGLSFMEGSVETMDNATTIINSKLLTLYSLLYPLNSLH